MHLGNTLMKECMIIQSTLENLDKKKLPEGSYHVWSPALMAAAACLPVNDGDDPSLFKCPREEDNIAPNPALIVQLSLGSAVIGHVWMWHHDVRFESGIASPLDALGLVQRCLLAVQAAWHAQDRATKLIEPLSSLLSAIFFTPKWVITPYLDHAWTAPTPSPPTVVVVEAESSSSTRQEFTQERIEFFEQESTSPKQVIDILLPELFDEFQQFIPQPDLGTFVRPLLSAWLLITLTRISWSQS
jgi:hypothetical protein